MLRALPAFSPPSTCFTTATAQTVDVGLTTLVDFFEPFLYYKVSGLSPIYAQKLTNTLGYET
jgi:hypothetical protein